MSFSRANSFNLASAGIIAVAASSYIFVVIVGGMRLYERIQFRSYRRDLSEVIVFV